MFFLLRRGLSAFVADPHTRSVGGSESYETMMLHLPLRLPALASQMEIPRGRSLRFTVALLLHSDARFLVVPLGGRRIWAVYQTIHLTLW